MQSKLSINNKRLKTSILIKKNYISKFINNIAKNNEKVFCILDNKIKLNFVKQKNVKIISIQCGEKIKTFEGYKVLSERLIKNNVNRKSVIVAIGGGTLGDLAGFVASTLLRVWIFSYTNYTFIQVDSSIGGKNEINTIYGKNLLGTFYQPKEVLIDISTLRVYQKNK